MLSFGGHQRAIIVASMRPRPFSRGNPAVQIKTWRISYGFNEAATIQSRKWARGRRPPFAAACFNEAATIQSRKYAQRCGTMMLSPGFNEAATIQSRKCSQAVFSIRRKCCFNEAATIQSRKSRSARIQGAGLVASMRPRPFSRGNASCCGKTDQFSTASMRPRPFSRGNKRLRVIPNERVLLQ